MANPADWTSILTGSALVLFTLWKGLRSTMKLGDEQDDARAAVEFEESNKRADARARMNQQMLIEAHREIEKEKFGEAEARADERTLEMNAATILAGILGPGPVSEAASAGAPAVAVDLAVRIRAELIRTGAIKVRT